MPLRNFFLILAIGSCTLGSAQQWSIGLFGGASHYLGELNNNSYDPNGLHPAAGGFVRYLPNPYIGFRFGVTTGTISGDDYYFPNATPEQLYRKLMFRSYILEAAFLVELNVIGYDVDDQRFSPYLFAGIAGFNFNPRAERNAEWHDLQPLRTEGQGTSAFPDRKPYSLYQAAVPFGMGFHFGLGAGLTLSLEAGMRYLFTDYLDDVSQTYVNANIHILEVSDLAHQLSNRTDRFTGVEADLGNNDPRGNPNNNDWYGFGGLTLSYTFGSTGGGNGKSGCGYGF